jgi:D-aminoacyl-tRNA deacylase
LKNYLLALQGQKEKKNLGYEVCLEASHHGPFLQKPSVFIELGSSEKQWQDKAAARAIANVIINSTSLEGNFKSAIALGGTHYCQEFSKLVLRTDWAIGHICPEYALPSLDDQMLQMAIDCTIPRPEAIILDWKGLGKEKARVMELLGKQNLPVLRARKLLG